MNYYRGGKIVATVGPSTNDFDKLEKLLLSGVNVFRLNFSHGTHDAHKAVYESIRSIGEKHNCHPTILADMQGPKLRVGVFENDKIMLGEGAKFRFDLDSTAGNESRVNLPHPEILEALKKGSTLLLDDGKLRFEVTDASSTFADVKVIVGGALSNRKGVNVPDVMLNIPILTPKDMKDLEFALGLGADWIALSFVQSVNDVENAKKIIAGRAGVVSKLEKPLAIKAMAPIIEASDAIMVARGDLGVEMNPEDVPVAQRMIIQTSRRLGKPVIVATQMMESMITAPVPTRAEVSDIATAVYYGSDATMLSAESASGSYPFEAVQMMSKVITRIESDQENTKIAENDQLTPLYTTTDAICKAAVNAAEYSSAKAIILFANDFNTVIRCARLRPKANIIFVTNSIELARKAGLYHGVYSVLSKKEFEQTAKEIRAKGIAKEYKFAEVGDNIVILNTIDMQMTSICRINE